MLYPASSASPPRTDRKPSTQHPAAKGPLCLEGTKKYKMLSMIYAIGEASARFSM